MLTGAPGHDIVEKNRRDLCHGTDPVPQGGAPLNKNLLRSILLIITYSVVLVLVLVKIDLIWAVAAQILGALKPLFLGFAIAFVLNRPCTFFFRLYHGGLAGRKLDRFSRPLAVLFAITLILTYAGGFNMVASYNLQSTFSGYSFYDPATTPWVIGAILAVLVGYCLMGGGKRIMKVTSTLVPFMGGMYVLVALIVVVLHIQLLPQVLGRIFSEAFDFQSIFAGFTGSAMMYGIKRGLFSNEAGVGSAPNAAASAHVSHPAKQGLVQMLSVFIDTLLICSATAFMLLCSGVEPTKGLEGAPYVQAALQNVFGAAGPVFITVAMVLFAFTTLIGNLYYVDNALNYIVGRVPAREFMVLFRINAMIVIFIGAGQSIDLVWNLADVLMGLMALINLPVILILARPALDAMKDYAAQRKAGKNPVFKAKDIGLEGKTEYWQ